MAVVSVWPSLPANYEMWSDIERLNKERDLVGIYLSAHPLDEYAAILNYVCNTKVTELDNLEALSSKAEVTFGGIVNSVSTGYTKKGNPMGTVIIEDYSGQHKIALFGKDWGAHKDSFYEGVPVFVRAKSEPGQWDATRFNLNIRSVEMLSDVKDSLITKVTLSIPLDKLTEEMVQDLQELTKNNPGNAQLSFYIKQNEQINANFTARNILINLSRSIVDYVEQHKEIEMKVN